MIFKQIYTHAYNVYYTRAVSIKGIYFQFSLGFMQHVKLTFLGGPKLVCNEGDPEEILLSPVF